MRQVCVQDAKCNFFRSGSIFQVLPECVGVQDFVGIQFPPECVGHLEAGSFLSGVLVLDLPLLR